MTTPAIRAENVTKTYAGVTALKGVSLEIPYGERFGLIGPDGAGKSTLIRILCSLMPFDSGKVLVAGNDVRGRIRAVRGLVGYMPQRFSLYPDLTVQENLSFYADLFSVSPEARKTKLKELLAFSHLEPFLKRRAGKLSGGMKQKLALACTLIHEPSIMLLDEPTTGVDPLSRHEFWQLLERLTERGITLLVTTPYMEEASRCHRIALMAEGKILEMDTPEKVRSGYSHPLYEVLTQDPFRAASILEKLPGVLTVQIFGSGIHLSVDHSQSPQNIRDQLSQMGIAVSDIRPIAPGIEDVFVEKMTEPSPQS
jgi:ABC-type multidrug transport system ATPase subunit